jgi:hypothetical protein
MTCFDSENYKNLKRAAKAEGDVFAFSMPAANLEYSGISVAFQPAIENVNGKMLNVAVSYCSNEDAYKKKHGKYHALRKLSNAQYIQLPLASMLRSAGTAVVADYLVDVFSV